MQNRVPVRYFIIETLRFAEKDRTIKENYIAYIKEKRNFELELVRKHTRNVNNDYAENTFRNHQRVIGFRIESFADFSAENYL